MINQAKLKPFYQSSKYKFGYIIPRNYNHAMFLDEKYGSTRWKDAILTEMGQLDEYEVFIDKGHKDNMEEILKQLDGYKKIRIHLVFDIKHDTRHKARMVADGHLTDVPLTSVYYGVVTLRGLRLITFLAELNSLQYWSTDIGNAYLEAVTS